MQIKAVYLNEKYPDQYTIVTDQIERDYRHGAKQREYACLCLNSQPTHPQYGISQWSTATIGPHLGREITLDDLPDNVREHALERING